MKKFIILISILFALPVSAASLIKYDDNDVTVPGRVIKYQKSGDQSEYLNNHNDLTTAKSGYLINTNLSAVDGIEQKYWKVVNGSIVEMTIGEKSDIDDLLNPSDPLDNFDEADSNIINVITGYDLPTAVANYGIDVLALIIALAAWTAAKNITIFRQSQSSDGIPTSEHINDRWFDTDTSFLYIAAAKGVNAIEIGGWEKIKT